MQTIYHIDMSKFPKSNNKIDIIQIKLEEDLKKKNFCGEICTLCGGGTQNCRKLLLLRIRELEDTINRARGYNY